MRALESDAQNESSMRAEPAEPQIIRDALVLTSTRSEIPEPRLPGLGAGQDCRVAQPKDRTRIPAFCTSTYRRRSLDLGYHKSFGKGIEG